MSIFTTSNNIIFGLHLPFFVPSFVLTGALVALLNITKPPKKLSLVYQDIVENRGKKKVPVLQSHEGKPGSQQSRV